MYVDNINISDGEIRYAERILLKQGQYFDDDRKRFIRDFTTLDLHAVPGSGKTTLLLAKLLILEKRLPLYANKGVLVISHTNTAIEEIRCKIKSYCPKLFSFPNFVGTIQSFINQYLAIPYYESILKKKVLYIDSDIYDKEVERYYNNLPANGLKGWLIKSYKSDPIGFLKKIRLDKNNELKETINGSSDKFILKNSKSRSYKEIIGMKNHLFSSGILHYDDAYYLAQRYIQQYPQIRYFIQSRFKYVFVDEMQDMAPHQYELLESLFYDSNNNISSFQRIGDNNQSIYNNSENYESIWTRRHKVLQISGSNRMTKYNAQLSSRFALDGTDIIGLNRSTTAFKPVLFVYKSNDYKCTVIQKFIEYLKSISLFQENTIHSPVVKVIAWRKEEKEAHKVSLISYCPRYIENSGKNFIIEEIGDLNKLKPIMEKGFAHIRNEILTFIVKILKTEQVMIEDNMPTKARLLKYLKESYLEEFDELNRKTYRWCKLIFQDKQDIIAKELKEYIPILLGVFSKKIDLAYKMLVDTKEFQNYNDNITIEEYECEKCKVGESKVEICSAHSIKGETHDVTLFLESFYDSKYESDILHEVLSGKSIGEIIDYELGKINKLEQELLSLNGKRGTKIRKKEIKKCKNKIQKIKQYAKLVFVALSRARGVVAYGISHERYKKYLENKVIEDEWVIKEIF